MGRHQPAGDGVRHHFRRSADARGQHGHLHRERFERRIGQPLGVRRQHHEVGVLKEPGRLLNVAGQMHPVLETGRLNARGEVGARRAVAGQDS